LEIENINSLYLFGSCARGDSGIQSDIDIISISQQCYALDAKANESNLKNTDMSYYSFDKIQEYFIEGHLFAWHLFLEAKHISGLDIIRELGKPNPYVGIKKDILELSLLLYSIEKRVNEKIESTSLIFEAGLLYVVLRNVGHALSWHELESPCFNKMVPFFIDKSFPIILENYNKLVAARCTTTRGGAAPTIEREWLIGMIKCSKYWVENKTRVYL
jgi:predicted nucleotidyltransferase